MADPENDFWAFYLEEHSRPATRAMHVAGTSLAVVLVILAAVLLQPWFLAGALVAGYLFAWVGHFAFERNRPATFRYPVKSFLSDWRLWALTLTGRIGRELERHGLAKGS